MPAETCGCDGPHKCPRHGGGDGERCEEGHFFYREWCKACRDRRAAPLRREGGDDGAEKDR